MQPLLLTRVSVRCYFWALCQSATSVHCFITKENSEVDAVKNKIANLRKPLKLSQKELAEKCRVTRQTINAIENDKYDPTLQLAFDLARVLQTTVDELFESE
ncbi:helix-turn-helix transcriptional regulator [Jeotgalibaca porci]|uniref:Helix-turn-helix transcriptional regulator n=1 Tax=Jeotgalibaca porci TaxID=1868793 RepID=A0A6G7WI50_9LACT|nr:helix-turn-helix transcriptional regulator [Jeotgalibaca porci]